MSWLYVSFISTLIFVIFGVKPKFILVWNQKEAEIKLGHVDSKYAFGRKKSG